MQFSCIVINDKHALFSPRKNVYSNNSENLKLHCFISHYITGTKFEISKSVFQSLEEIVNRLTTVSLQFRYVHFSFGSTKA